MTPFWTAFEKQAGLAGAAGAAWGSARTLGGAPRAVGKFFKKTTRAAKSEFHRGLRSTDPAARAKDIASVAAKRQAQEGLVAKAKRLPSPVKALGLIGAGVAGHAAYSGRDTSQPQGYY